MFKISINRLITMGIANSERTQKNVFQKTSTAAQPIFSKLQKEPASVKESMGCSSGFYIPEEGDPEYEQWCINLDKEIESININNKIFSENGRASTKNKK